MWFTVIGLPLGFENLNTLTFFEKFGETLVVSIA